MDMPKNQPYKSKRNSLSAFAREFKGN